MRGLRRPARAVAVITASGVLAAVLAASPPAPAEHDTDHDPRTKLYLVTLDGPGTAGPASDDADALLEIQDDLLDTIGADQPLYRWTTALNGFAVELDPIQVAQLSRDPQVAFLEEDRVVSLAAAGGSAPPTAATSAPGRLRTTAATQRPPGAGTVIGFIGTGIAPETPAFRAATSLGPLPERFRGSCTNAPADDSWDEDSCDAKVVGAQFFVAAYGAERLRSLAALSPYDTDGHGTRMASIAAGATDVRVRVGEHRLGLFSGVAPGARVAAYKACWSAPDPDDDGCAIADVVTAIDRATADRVDVLNLSLGGRAQIDTVERALLGAAEEGIVVTAAAGNKGERAYASHPSPWVVTVGATIEGDRVGDVVIPGGPRLRGAMAVTGAVEGRVLLGARVAAPGVSRQTARHCVPGSLDAAEADGAVVICARGEGSRIDKSRAVALAGGVGMVLANTRRGSTDADLHAVPTVHLAVAEARRLTTWVRRHEQARVRLAPRGIDRRPAQLLGFSSGGDPTSSVLKPDLVAPGSEVVAATGAGWDLVTGTSPAAARVAGTAAVLLARPGARPATVRSELLTTAEPIGGPVALRAGSGMVRRSSGTSLTYVVPPSAYRAWLSGERTDVNRPQVLLSDGRLRARRTLTNTGARTVELTAYLEGFTGEVRMTPTYARLRPGEKIAFRVIAWGTRTSTDDGAVVWHTAAGDTARMPVVITR